MEEMKPCPFDCGSEVRLVYYIIVANLIPWKGYSVYFPQCSDQSCPGHNTHAYFTSEEEAIERWNKRIEPFPEMHRHIFKQVRIPGDVHDYDDSEGSDTFIYQCSCGKVRD